MSAPWTGAGVRAVLAAAVTLVGGVGAALAEERGDERPDEDALFGGGTGDDVDATSPYDSVFDGEPAPPAAPADTPSGFGDGDGLLSDPLAIGGQLYLRLVGQISDRGSAGSQRLSMPNLLDVYLDARPEDRVRAFFSGRLSFDPTIVDGEPNDFGQSQSQARALVDQLWIKTDIARTVFLTLGQERIKWGTSRIWNPTDFANARRRDPLAVFDERTGVPMLKVNVPVDTWNFYLLGLLGGASRFDEPGLAFRVEKAFSASEFSVSGVAGEGRKTAFGFDVSTALGPLDLTVEFSLTDERETPTYRGDFDVETFTLPTEEPHGAWAPRVTAGLQYGFKPNDDDVQYIGVEYFYNAMGSEDPDLYPWLLLQGQLEPFYLGKHYLGLIWLVPAPGRWDDATFTLSNLANLSDRTFVTRLDASFRVHTKLSLEAYAQVHYGERGGELRFALDVPDIPAIPGLLEEPIEGFSVPAPAVVLGLNLRVAM